MENEKYDELFPDEEDVAGTSTAASVTLVKDQNEVTLEDVLKCPACGTKFEKIDEHTYKYACDCISKDIRVSVG